MNKKQFIIQTRESLTAIESAPDAPEFMGGEWDTEWELLKEIEYCLRERFEEHGKEQERAFERYLSDG